LNEVDRLVFFILIIFYFQERRGDFLQINNDIFIFVDVAIDVQVLYHDQKLNELDSIIYSYLSSDNIDDLSFYIKHPTSLESAKWPINPMLAYMDVKSIDPFVPKEVFEDMG
jgi:hypothetical protein